VYLPLLGAVNVIYLLVRWLSVGMAVPAWSEALGLISIFGLQAFAYVGILENSANRSSKDKSLVGGASLDILGLTILIQFLALLWTPKCYWLLLGLPVWGLYFLYKTFRGGSTPAAAAEATSTKPDNDKQAERTQQRAERRRQKRG
jgi:hypothetical protein